MRKTKKRLGKLGLITMALVCFCGSTSGLALSANSAESKQIPELTPSAYPAPPQAVVANQKNNAQPNVKTEMNKKSAPVDLRKPLTRVWDFQNANVKEIPKFWESTSGSWILSSEPEHPSNRVLKQTIAKRSFQYLLSGNSYANFEFSAKVRVDSFEQKTRNWQIGLIFRQANPSYYYKFRITAANVALLRCSPETLEVLPISKGTSRVASATGRFGKENEQILMILPMTNAADQWHTMSVACYGERITLKLNGREIRMLNDPVIGSGKVGVFTYKSQAFVDDLRLYYLPIPDMKQGLLPVQETFSLKQDRDLLIYFKNPDANELELRVLDAHGKLYYLLTKGKHAAGLGSITWDGQGIDGKISAVGNFTLELKTKGKRQTASVRVKP